MGEINGPEQTEKKKIYIKNSVKNKNTSDT